MLLFSVLTGYDVFRKLYIVFLSIFWEPAIFSIKQISIYSVLRFEQVIVTAEFKGERLGRPPRGLRKTEIGSTDFIETFDSLISRKVSLCFQLK
jgi:hypothetical protein